MVLPEGTRIRLIEMVEDPDPIETGALGTVIGGCDVVGLEQIWVRWDNGRNLNLIPGTDIYEVI